MKNDALNAQVTQPVERLYEFAGHTLDPARRRLVGPGGSDIALSNKSFDALAYLLERPGTLVSRDELMQALWPKRVVEPNNLNQAIAGLRRALGEDHVVTVAGRGYQWVTPVRRFASLSDRATASDDRSVAADGGEPCNVARAPIAAKPRRLVSGALALVLGIAATIAWVRDDALVESPPMGALQSIAPVTSYPGVETMPALSPDGMRIAFSWREGSSRSIYATAIGTATPIRLTSAGEGSDEYPAWSPNGKQIAFLRRYDPERFDLVTVPADGGHERTLYSGRMYWISVEGFPLIAWTPDSRQLLFTSRVEPSVGAAHDRFALHRLTLDTLAVELAVTPVPGGYDTSPAVAPNGAWLAFTRYRPGERLNSIMLQRLDASFAAVGEAQPIPELAPGVNLSLHWGASSDRLYFGTGGKIFEWPMDGTARAVHTLGPTLSAPLMSMVQRGDGTRAAIVVQEANAEIFALQLDPVTHASIGAPSVRVPSTGADYHPRFSPDGTKLAFVSDRNNGERALWIAEADGRNPRQLTELDELITGFPRWSPDGTRIAFHTSAANEERLIYIVEVRSGRTQRLINGCCPGGWSADGRYLYLTDLTSGVNRIERVEVSSGRREPLFEGETPSESADGRYLLYSKARAPGYFRRSLDGVPHDNPEERLVEDYRPAAGGLAPVADGFFYVAFTPEGQARAIRFFDYARGEPRDIAPVPVNTLIGLTVSPDGRELLYAATEEPEADIRLYEFANASE